MTSLIRSCDKRQTNHDDEELPPPNPIVFATIIAITMMMMLMTSKVANGIGCMLVCLSVVLGTTVPQVSAFAGGITGHWATRGSRTTLDASFLDGIAENIGGFLEDLTGGIGNNNNNKSTNQERELLKAELLEFCKGATAKDRPTIEAIMAKLTPLTPVIDTASSPLLQKEWLL